MLAITNNLYNKDYLDNGTTTLIKRTAHNDNITDNHTAKPDIVYRVVCVSIYVFNIFSDNINQTPNIEYINYLNVPKNLVSLIEGESLVYSIIRVRDGKKYIGKTSNLQKRMNGWNYDINNPNSPHYYCKLSKAVRKGGEFIVKVIEFTTWELLEDREDHWIKTALDANEKLFNVNRGGGGGCAFPTGYTSKEPLPPNFNTPIKDNKIQAYPITVENGNFDIEFTPTAGSKYNIVYQIMCIDNKLPAMPVVEDISHANDDIPYIDARLIGESNRSAETRALEYISDFNNPERKNTDGTGKMKTVILNNPTRKFGFVILGRFQDPYACKRMERGAVAEKKSQDKTVLNCNDAGTGPYSKRKIVDLTGGTHSSGDESSVCNRPSKARKRLNFNELNDNGQAS